MARKVVPEKVEEAKEKIISATMDLIIQDGFSKLTLANVAKKAGITKAAIYWYFSSKEELLNAMVFSLRATFIDSTKQMALQPIPAKQKVEAFFGALENNEVHRKCLLLVKVFLELCSTSDETKTIIQAGYKEYIEIIQGIFDEAIMAREIKFEISSTTLSKILIAALDGCTIHNEMFGGQWIDFKEVQKLFSLLSGEGNA